MSGQRAFWILMPVLLLALVLQLGRAGTRWRASRMINAVEQVTEQLIAAGGRAPRQLLEHHLKLLREAAALDPLEVKAPYTQARHYVMMERYSAAIQAFHRALEIEPRAEIYRYMGEAQWAMGDKGAARQSFTRAIDLDYRMARKLRKYMPERLERWRKLRGNLDRRKGRKAGDGAAQQRPGRAREQPAPGSGAEEN